MKVDFAASRRQRAEKEGLLCKGEYLKLQEGGTRFGSCQSVWSIQANTTASPHSSGSATLYNRTRRHSHLGGLKALSNSKRLTGHAGSVSTKSWDSTFRGTLKNVCDQARCHCSSVTTVPPRPCAATATSFGY